MWKKKRYSMKKDNGTIAVAVELDDETAALLERAAIEMGMKKGGIIANAIEAWLRDDLEL